MIGKLHAARAAACAARVDAMPPAAPAIAHPTRPARAPAPHARARACQAAAFPYHRLASTRLPGQPVPGKLAQDREFR